MARDQDVLVHRKAGELVERVKDCTRSELGDDCRALYAYGSYARRTMGRWSDLDIIAVEREAVPVERLQAWSKALVQYGRQQQIPIDASSLRPRDILPTGHWAYAVPIASLAQKSLLLEGRDCRAKMSYPSYGKLRVAITNSAMVFLRHLYSVDRSKRIPLTMEPPSELSARKLSSMGNFAWLAVVGATHLLRAVFYLRTKRLIHDKRELVKRLEAGGMVGDARLAQSLALAIEILPRRGRWRDSCGSIQSVCAALPALHSDLRGLMEAEGLIDPSYEPGGRSLYAASGDLAENVATS